MALLQLKGIGKIYVSEGNVAVGIRGVDLSFERGEFVAITGRSGSGKSTLLNVISGMDSYEEGELLIEGEPTSHYLQPDWEEYRQKYISFIFQDYNIIESFTVLQNVELALMHIADKKQRRRRALELLERVGLTSHIRQKGSRLSGGQKQRTVIARALAKDSPIILADEPTGNLDSATSKEIIALLREVSREKLLIVVTHNFEEVEACATRHIRIYDGAVESDRVLSRPAVEKQAPRRVSAPDKKADLRNGLTLGRSIFCSKPRLSLFLCLLMILGALGVFGVTAMCGQAGALFDDYEMFTHIDGRVVLTKQNGAPIGEDELQALAEKHGAEDVLHYDVLLDTSQWQYINYQVTGGDRGSYGMTANAVYGEHYGADILGAYPTEDDEIFLYLPIGKQPHFGKDSLLIDTVEYNGVELRVCGVKYFYDNNQNARILFTADGFRLMTAVYYLGGYSSNATIKVTLTGNGKKHVLDLRGGYTPSFAVEDGKLYIGEYDYRKLIKEYSSTELDVRVDYETVYYSYDHNYYASEKAQRFTASFGKEKLTDTPLSQSKSGINAISPYLLMEIANGVLESSYRQASLFFSDDASAHAAVDALRAEGYIAVPSDTVYTPGAEETILSMLGAVMVALVWLLMIVFLAFFLNLCSSRSLAAFKGDMAIMRSMGISVKTIRIGMYVRMLLALLPALIAVGVAAAVIFTSPKLNPMFTYLYAWQYALILLGMLILTLRITHKQIKRLFGESVKKALKGGRSE